MLDYYRYFLPLGRETYLVIPLCYKDKVWWYIVYCLMCRELESGVGGFGKIVVNSSTASNSVHLPYKRTGRTTPVGDGLLLFQMPAHFAI